MYGTLRFTLEKGRSLPSPQYRTPQPGLSSYVDMEPFYGTTGVGGDLYVAAQDAVRAMVEHISSTYDLSEIVDAGQYIVSALLPEAVFEER